MDNGSLSLGESGRCAELTTHPILAPRLKKEHNYTSTPLPPFPWVSCPVLGRTLLFTWEGDSVDILVALYETIVFLIHVRRKGEGENIFSEQLAKEKCEKPRNQTTCKFKF
jgi:hypothetical protein